MGFSTRIISIYIISVFILIFLVLSPVLLITAQKVRWHWIALRVNRFWAKTFFRLAFLPTEVIETVKLDPKEQYIFCSNHFSYLDIPTMGLLPLPFKFIGKSSLVKIPVFGYMFRKIHIPVKRENYVNRGKAFLKSKEAIEGGFNLVFFPEGGITSKHIPKMHPFLDGAFQLSVNYQLPIVPVVIPDNHLIMPDDETYRFFPAKVKIKLGAPIYPEDNSESEVRSLKAKVFEIIQSELDQANMIEIAEEN